MVVEVELLLRLNRPLFGDLERREDVVSSGGVQTFEAGLCSCLQDPAKVLGNCKLKVKSLG
jgi:hypothetical protein